MREVKFFAGLVSADGVQEISELGASSGEIMIGEESGENLNGEIIFERSERLTWKNEIVGEDIAKGGVDFVAELDLPMPKVVKLVRGDLANSRANAIT